MDAETLKANLNHFTGSQQYHRWSMLFRNHVLTDGAKYLADQAQAYWLMDAIASHHVNPRVRQEEFQVWKLAVNNGSATLTCDDGNGNILARQRIGYTDFPLAEVKLYCIDRVILLPSEY